MTSLYQRLTSTPAGQQAMAGVRLRHSLQNVIREAAEENGYLNDLKDAENICDRLEEGNVAVDEISKILHRFGKEILIELVEAGEPRRQAEKEMIEQAKTLTNPKKPLMSDDWAIAP